MDIQLRAPKTGHDFERYYDLRWRILRKPWGGERCGNDPGERTAIHLTAWDGDKLVGAGRVEFLSPEEGRVRGMAVEDGYEKRGIGSRILQGLEERATQAGVKRLMLHARETALEFYRKNHYQTVERSYTLFGSIPHWKMHKVL